MSKNVLASFISNSFPCSSLNLKLLWWESCPDKRHISLSGTNVISFQETQYDEYNCQAVVSSSSGLQANMLRLVGNHSTFTSFSPCSLSLSIEEALAGTSEWIYFVVALSRGWKAHTCHLSSIWATGGDWLSQRPGIKLLIHYWGDSVLPTARDVGLPNKSEVIFSVDRVDLHKHLNGQISLPISARPHWTQSKQPESRLGSSKACA